MGVSVSGRVYSYLRFSDPRQAKGHSIDRQAAYAAKWAADHGLVLDASLNLRDEGLSAYHQRHVKSGALGVFLAAVEGGQVPPGSVLVVEGLDRLSRAEPIQAQAQLAQIVNAGITVVTASDGKTYSREALKANPMDLVYSLLVMIRAHEESDTKSKRVTASIKKQCENWMTGTYRGLIRNGKDPQWLRLDENKQWQIIPERVEAVRLVVDMYTRGYGANLILDELHTRQLSPTDGKGRKLQIYRMIKLRALIGEKEIEVDGETFCLPGYYPPIITLEQWHDLRNTASTRKRAKIKGTFPTIITGHGFTFCGYCGTSLVSQTMSDVKKRDANGLITDAHTRVRCHTNFEKPGGQRCLDGGSCSAAPIERAIINYCSDMLNLRSLYGEDRAAAPRARLAELRHKIDELERQLEKLTSAMLETDEAPAIFIRKAKAMEDELATMKTEEQALESECSATSRHSLAGADEAWRNVVDGVTCQDYDARMRARQLVHETFERIVVWWKGINPGTCPPGTIDVLLVAKGGIPRMIRIDNKGQWSSMEGLAA